MKLPQAESGHKSVLQADGSGLCKHILAERAYAKPPSMT